METVQKDRDAMVALYAPYCEGDLQPQLLERALEKLYTRRINGSRRLKPDGSHPFELTWQPGESPQEPSQCQLILDSAPSSPAPPLPPLNRPAPPMPATGLGLGTPSLPLPPLPLGAPVVQARAPAQGATEASTHPDLPASFWCWLLVGQLPEDRSA